MATSTMPVKFSSNYVPYGSNYAVSGKEVFMYTGKPADSATGLYYEGARYYDSSTGRFITQDSYSGSRSDPMTLNRYIYARDNPEKMVDRNGHMFLVSATMLDGIMARKWAAPPPVSSTVTDYTDINKVSTVTGPTTVIIGKSTKSVDVTLTQKGNSQYASVPTIGIEYATSSSTSAQTRGNPTGAWLVVALLGTLTVASGLATVATSPLALTGIGAIVPAFFASTTIGLAYSTWDAGVYTATEGPNATPEGAIASTPLDVGLQWLGDLISRLP